MKQSRRMSLAEACANVGIGYGVSVAANFAILPLSGFRPSMSDSLAIGLMFTVVSLVRQYIMRRLFERVRKTPPAATSPLFVSLRGDIAPELIVGDGASTKVWSLSPRQVERLAYEAATILWMKPRDRIRRDHEKVS